MMGQLGTGQQSPLHENDHWRLHLCRQFFQAFGHSFHQRVHSVAFYALGVMPRVVTALVHAEPDADVARTDVLAILVEDLEEALAPL